MQCAPSLGATCLTRCERIRAPLSRLYQKALSLSQPFAFEQWRKQKVQEKLDAKTANRIAPVKHEKLPKINAELARELRGKSGKKRKAILATAAAEKAAGEEEEAKPTSLLNDARFKSLFNNPDFEIDKTNEEYLARRPHERGNVFSKGKKPREDESDEEEMLAEVDGGELEEEDSDEEESEESDDKVAESKDSEVTPVAGYAFEQKEHRAIAPPGRRNQDGASAAAARASKSVLQMVGLSEDLLGEGEGMPQSVLPSTASFAERLARMPQDDDGLSLHMRHHGTIGGAGEFSFSANELRSRGSEKDLYDDSDVYGKGRGKGRGKGGKGKGKGKGDWSTSAKGLKGARGGGSSNKGDVSRRGARPVGKGMLTPGKGGKGYKGGQGGQGRGGGRGRGRQ